MKKRIFSYLSRASQPGWLLLIVVLQVLFMYAFHGIFPFSVEKIGAVSGGMGIPDTRMFYSFEQLQNLFRHYGTQGREIYLQLQWVDMVYPLVYSTLLAALMFLVFHKTRFENLIFIPFVAMFFDYAENILLRVSILSFPHMNKMTVAVAGSVTFLKWLFLFLVLFLLLSGFIWRIIRWQRLAKTGKSA